MRIIGMRLGILPAILSIVPALLLSQARSKEPLSFEVASVKPMDPNDTVFVEMSADPSIVTYRNLTLRDAIRGAYKVNDFR